MSDVESNILRNDPSICSEQDQELAPGFRSLSSVHLIDKQSHTNQHTQQAAMSDEENYGRFSAGSQKPPHHKHEQKTKQKETYPPPVPPLQKQPSTLSLTHQWTFDIKESSGSFSPKKEPFNVSDPNVPSLAPASKKTSKEQKKTQKQGQEPILMKSMSDGYESDPSETKHTGKEPRKNKHFNRESFHGTVRERRGDPSAESSLTEEKRQQSGSAVDGGSSAITRAGGQTEEDAMTGHSSRDGQSSDQTSALNKRSRYTPTVANTTKDALNQRNINREAIAAYVRTNLHQRECKVYARNTASQSNQACHCGREKRWHDEKRIQVKMDTDRTFWHAKTHTQLLPCDSFGEILFRGFGSQSDNSPYVRLDHMTEMEKVWTLLIDYWHLPVPKLLISITGGAKRFNLKERHKNMLKQGLVTAAVSTGAWIITGGTAAGVMELVGEALHDHLLSTGNTDRSQCVALGIASWGVIANNVALDGEGDNGLFPAQYAMEDIQAYNRNRVALDHNHTHFLLVDDGTEGKYGGEIEFRAKLESHISSIVETGVAETQSINVPSVLIVVEGGVNTLQTVRESIRRKIPVVIISGSGRVADFIALGYRLTRTSADEDKTVFPYNFAKTMRQKAKVIFEWQPNDRDVETKIFDCVNLLKECLQERKLVNVFNLDKADSVKDIDRAILYALLRANKSNANSQLALALAWNRCDIARQEIFTSANRQHWQSIDLYSAMFTALVQNRADFVQLFLDNGLDLKRFLTIKTLWNLYCNCIKGETDPGAQLLRYLITYLKQTWGAFLLCRDPPDWENFPDLLLYVGKVVSHLLQDQKFHFYSDTKFNVTNEDPTMEWKDDKSKKNLMKKQLLRAGNFFNGRRRRKANVKSDFESPERELFLWAILFNRTRLVRLFWKQGRDHIGGALFASALLKQLSQFADSEEEDDVSAEMATTAGDCEQWAVGVLSECFAKDKQLTHHLLVRELPLWGQSTLFTIADTYEMMDFSGHSACQTKVSSIWKGRMALYTSEIKIAVCIFLPVLVSFIKFNAEDALKEEDKKNTGSEEGPESAQTSRGSPLLNNTVSPRGLPDDDHDGKGFVRAETRREKIYTIARKFNKVHLFDLRTVDNINIFVAILYFYRAPITKFFCNVISYMVFMGLFTYFVLIELTPVATDSPSIYEYITWMWLGTMVLEEIRQVMSRDHGSVRYKLKSWFGNVWNKFDLLMYVLFAVSIILRYLLGPEWFVWARIIYSISMALFYLRFLQFFYAEKNIGPKVIMIRKMLADLWFFVAILLVFILSFGTAYQANLFPRSPPTWEVLKNVFYFPYFQMHGEYFLDEMQGVETPDCTHNQTLWQKDPDKRCPEVNKVVPTLLAIYLVLTNILLVNLLIAMFSYTFQNVQANSLKVWRYYRLSLVFEYADRPTLVPPIIIINHVLRFLRWLCHLAKIKGCVHRVNPLRFKLSPEDHNRLTLFERMAMENYLTHSKQLSKGSLDNQVATTAERIENIMEELEMIKDTIQHQESQSLQTGSVLPDGQPKEADIMEGASSSSAPGSKPTSRESLEIERLSKCVEELSAKSSATSLKLEQVLSLLQASLSQQQQRVKSWTRPVPLDDVSDDDKP